MLFNHKPMPNKKRCFWVNQKSKLYVEYHDNEWGKECHDDKKLFEMLLLECFQAGLSWECVLNKRESFRQAFDNFDAKKIANYREDKLLELEQNEKIIRNKLKIRAAKTNAAVFLDISKVFGSFDSYIWRFCNGKPIYEACDLRSTSPLSDEVSKDLKKRGMKFVGSTIIYSYLQAIGIINGHMEYCHKYVPQT